MKKINYLAFFVLLVSLQFAFANDNDYSNDSNRYSSFFIILTLLLSTFNSIYLVKIRSLKKQLEQLVEEQELRKELYSIMQSIREAYSAFLYENKRHLSLSIELVRLDTTLYNIISADNHRVITGLQNLIHFEINYFKYKRKVGEFISLLIKRGYFKKIAGSDKYLYLYLKNNYIDKL